MPVPGRRHKQPTITRYPRSARVNELLRQVLAEALEKVSDTEDSLTLLTVTAVDTDPDLRHATVYFASLPEAAAQALEDLRIKLQREIGRQARLKRTPLLAFAADPGVASGRRVDEILSRIGHPVADADAEP
ncbi:MAG: ribosome-binding factor A, partial [Acidimicrobiales bacterium]